MVKTIHIALDDNDFDLINNIRLDRKMSWRDVANFLYGKLKEEKDGK
jgi:hypothetical protein